MIKPNILMIYLVVGIFGISAIFYSVIKHENRTIEQSNNLEKMCLKAYKTDLKNDSEIKELCKDVKVKIGELQSSK